MTDSEKLELMQLITDIDNAIRSLEKIKERAKKTLGGIPDKVENPKFEAPVAQVAPLGTSMYDSVGTVPNISKAEVDAHTMEYKERITR